MHCRIKKVIYCVMIMNMTSLAMEQTQPLLIKKKSSKESLEISSSPSAKKSDNPYTFSLPTYQTLTNAFGSLKETVYNYAWDDSAFKKLGWPPLDELAQQELKKRQDTYQRVNDALRTRVYYETFVQDCDVINRSHDYCQRVLGALETHPHGVELALFCLTHHRQAMNQFDITRFLVFVDEKKATITQGTKRIYADLAELTMVPKDSPLLTNFFEQPIVSTVSKEKIVEKNELKKSDSKKDSKK